MSKILVSRTSSTPMSFHSRQGINNDIQGLLQKSIRHNQNSSTKVVERFGMFGFAGRGVCGRLLHNIRRHELYCLGGWRGLLRRIRAQQTLAYRTMEASRA